MSSLPANCAHTIRSQRWPLFSAASVSLERSVSSSKSAPGEFKKPCTVSYAIDSTSITDYWQNYVERLPTTRHCYAICFCQPLGAFCRPLHGFPHSPISFLDLPSSPHPNLLSTSKLLPFPLRCICAHVFRAAIAHPPLYISYIGCMFVHSHLVPCAYIQMLFN